MLGIRILITKRSNDAFKETASGILYIEKKNIELASRIPRSPSEIGSRDLTNIITLVPIKACSIVISQNALIRQNICTVTTA
jgi:hypothetical protein